MDRRIISATRNSRLVFAAAAVLILVFAARAARSQNEWKKYESLSVSGKERVAGGKERSFNVSKSHGKLHFSTQRGLDGSLIGETRNEENIASGIFTWLADRPSWALQLTEPSMPEYGSIIQPSRFSKSALMEARQTIERSLGKKIIDFKTVTLQNRNCFEVTSGDPNTPANYQKLWIDSETGIVLQRIDTSNRMVDYQYSVEAVKPDQVSSKGDFAVPGGATVIRGFVHPEILKHAGETATLEDFRKALAGANVAPGSVMSIPVPDGFDYVHTQTATWKGRTPGSVKSGGALGSALVLPGGLPSGWSVNSDVNVEKGTIVMDFLTPEGGGPKAMINLPSGVQDSSSFQIQISNDKPGSEPIDIKYVSFVDSNGSLILAPGDSVETAKERRKAEEILNGSSVIQSDFLDPKTGDTVSFVQLHNRPLSSVFKASGLTAQKPIQHSKLGDVKVYRLESPFAAIVVSWKRGENLYALTSTRLSVEELVKLAEKAGMAK